MSFRHSVGRSTLCSDRAVEANAGAKNIASAHPAPPTKYAPWVSTAHQNGASTINATTFTVDCTSSSVFIPWVNAMGTSTTELAQSPGHGKACSSSASRGVTPRALAHRGPWLPVCCAEFAAWHSRRTERPLDTHA